MPIFPYETILTAGDICNLAKTKEALLSGCTLGQRLVFFGYRNTGKTSLLQSIVLPYFQSSHPGSICVFIDAMDIRSEDDFARRLQVAMEEALSKSKGAKDLIRQLGKVLKQIRPSFNVDPYSGEPSFTFGFEPIDYVLPFAAIIRELGRYHQTHKSLLIIDEFQDVDLVPGLAAKLRKCLQELPSDLPVVVTGSKKHILARMFGDPRAPFASWGKHIEIEKISFEEYFAYANLRFDKTKNKITSEACEFLYARMRGLPEPMNIICDQLCQESAPGETLQLERVERTIMDVVKNRSSLFRERLSRFSEKEQRFLKAMADLGTVDKPTSKSFLKKANLSAGGCSPLLKRLENQAMIYRTEQGYLIDDPLLTEFLKVAVR